AASRLGRLDGLAYQSPPPSYCKRAMVSVGGLARADDRAPVMAARGSSATRSSATNGTAARVRRIVLPTRLAMLVIVPSLPCCETRPTEPADTRRASVRRAPRRRAHSCRRRAARALARGPARRSLREPVRRRQPARSHPAEASPRSTLGARQPFLA